MPRFAANLNFLYAELPYWERFHAAACDGFRAVELLFPQEHDAAALARVLDADGLTLLMFNATRRSHPLERGIACLPDHKPVFRERFQEALALAGVLRCRFLHVMAGVAPPGVPRLLLRATFVENLRWAAERADAQGCGVLVEPINPGDIPGFYLNRQAEAHAIVQEVGAANLQVMMDLYHCAKVEGDVLAALNAWLPTGRVGHLQIAGVPDRREPDMAVGAVDWPAVLRRIDDLGYTGWIGAEYHPGRGAMAGATSAGLQWLRTSDARPARG